MTSDLIRVVLADDHTVVRAGLKAVLGTAKDIDVVGEAKDGREAVALVDRFHPDVVVMDLSMVGMEVGEGIPRFTFDTIQLMRGLDFIAILIGLFGLSEILINAENPSSSPSNHFPNNTNQPCKFF